MSKNSDISGKGALPLSLFERQLATRYLRSKRADGGISLITIISFFGILLAVMVLIIVMSVMNGYRAKVIEIMTGAQGHIFIYTDRLEIEEIEPLRKRVSKVPGVKAARTMIFGNAAAMSPLAKDGDLALVFGIEPDALSSLDVLTSKITAGSLIGFGVGRNGGNQVVIGSIMARKFGLMVGDDITLLGFSGGTMTPFGTRPVRKTYQVGAIFKMGMADIDQRFVYMPLSQAGLFFKRGGKPDFIELRVDDPFDTPRLKQLVADAAGVSVYMDDWLDKNRSFVSALQIERTMMRMILMLVVLIAALNIISGLVMLVKNKGKDIGILRTMGASRGAIMRVFVMVGAAIGVFGTLLGVVFGVLFVWFIDPIQDFVQWVFGMFSSGTMLFDEDVYGLARLPAIVDWNEVLIIALFGFGASVLVTLLPSWRASRLDPVEALRYE
ncbi:Lipoprotein releasing system transmembrane protein LolC/LolE [hydrothermal vent metagenome]|uniref:Lipoprotein releasing system transmembrane protein LolC/LolE n=1 Tax=hydrothermal vent metagenome TaxID=652676 RepID=A0A3B0S966_9ZZZZ